MEVDDAQVAAQKARAFSSPTSPTDVPADLSTGSGTRASSTSKREIESDELGDMGAFDMDVEGDNPEVSVPKKGRIASLTIAGKCVNVSMQTAMMALLVNATLPNGEVYGHLRGELLDPLFVHEGREKARTCVSFGVYEGHQAVEKRLLAMQIAWETRTDCFAGTPALCCARLVLSFAATLCRGRRSKLCSLHDVPVAFHHALLDEGIWVNRPKGEEDEYGVVWQLVALYGTRAAVPEIRNASHGEDRVHSGACGSTDVPPRGMAGAGNCAR